MTSLSQHRQMLAMTKLNPAHSQSLVESPSRFPEEGGYTLVALIALMTVLALFAMAAAPSIVQQARREREKEAIFRGEQVAEAIRIYYNAQVRNGKIPGDPSLPTDIDQLLEGVPRGTKKVQILRASAARDPLSTTGEWRLVKSHSPEMTDFVRDLMVYAGNVPPPTRDPALSQAQQSLVPIVFSVGGLLSSKGPITSGKSSGPYVGVSSTSNLEAIMTYYGIDRHDRWVFTPFFR